MDMNEVYNSDFDVCDVSRRINSLMSRWSVHMIHIKGQNWRILNHSDELVCEFVFCVDFNDIDVRVKLEDLKLNVIHHIESLRDDTTYIDDLVSQELLDFPDDFF